MSKSSIPEGYEEYPEDRVQRLHTKPTGGREMKLSGAVKCPKSDCGKSVPFALRTHDASKVEFTTTCKRCKTKIALVFHVNTWVEEKTAFEMIEGAQPKNEDEAKKQYDAKLEEAKVKIRIDSDRLIVGEKDATKQLPITSEAIPGQPNEDKNEPSGDEQDKKDDDPQIKLPDAANKEDPFAGLE